MKYQSNFLGTQLVLYILHFRYHTTLLPFVHPPGHQYLEWGFTQEQGHSAAPQSSTLSSGIAIFHPSHQDGRFQ